MPVRGGEDGVHIPEKLWTLGSLHRCRNKATCCLRRQAGSSTNTTNEERLAVRWGILSAIRVVYGEQQLTKNCSQVGGVRAITFVRQRQTTGRGLLRWTFAQGWGGGVDTVNSFPPVDNDGVAATLKPRWVVYSLDF